MKTNRLRLKTKLINNTFANSTLPEKPYFLISSLAKVFTIVNHKFEVKRCHIPTSSTVAGNEVADLSEISFELDIGVFNKHEWIFETRNSCLGHKGEHGINIEILPTKDRLNFPRNTLQQFLQDTARMFQFDPRQVGGES